MEEKPRIETMESVPFQDIDQSDRYLTRFYRHAYYYNIVSKHNQERLLYWFTLSACRQYGIKQLYKSKNYLTVRHGDEEQTFESAEVGKIYYPQEFKALVAISDRFDFIHWYYGYLMGRFSIPGVWREGILRS